MSSSNSFLRIDDFTADLLETVATSLFRLESIPFRGSETVQKSDKELLVDIFKKRTFLAKTQIPIMPSTAYLLKDETLNVNSQDDLNSLLGGTLAAMKLSTSENPRRLEDGSPVDKSELLKGMEAKDSQLQWPTAESILSDQSSKNVLVSKLSSFHCGPPPPETSLDLSSHAFGPIVDLIMKERSEPKQAMFAAYGRSQLTETVNDLGEIFVASLRANVGMENLSQFVPGPNDLSSMRSRAAQMSINNPQAGLQTVASLAKTVERGIEKGYLRQEAFANLSERISLPGESAGERNQAAAWAESSNADEAADNLARRTWGDNY